VTLDPPMSLEESRLLQPSGHGATGLAARPARA
jgi:hypothetical protein